MRTQRATCTHLEHTHASTIGCVGPPRGPGALSPLRCTLGLVLAAASRTTVLLLLLAGCPGDDGGGGDGTDGSTGATTMSTMSGATTTPSTSSGSATTVEPTSSESGEQTSTTTMPPGTSSESGEGSGSTTSTTTCEGMTFFATSVGSGKNGGNLGGLEGADATCQMLADAAGQGGCTWHAYLSSSTEDARDRIGSGPWFNFAGDMIAADVDALHMDGLSNGDPQHVLDENGMEVPGDEHDILTGSQEDGTLLADTTCDDWTSNTEDFVAQVGHSDIPGNPMFSPSWNSAHDTPGCSADSLESTGGAGRLYCFAID